MKIISRILLLRDLYSEYRFALDLHDFCSNEYSEDAVRAKAKAFNEHKFFWMPHLREVV